MFHRIAVSMKTRPFQLSKLKFEGFTLLGYSVAGEESVIVVPEMDVVFDIGRCPREALRVNHVLLSHGHMDHAAGIAYYFSQRDFQGIGGGVALVSRPIVKPLENLMRAVAAVEGHPTPYKFIGMSDGDDYEIRRGLIVRAFTTHHIDNSSADFIIITVAHSDELIGGGMPFHCGYSPHQILKRLDDGARNQCHSTTDPLKIPLGEVIGNPCCMVHVSVAQKNVIDPQGFTRTSPDIEHYVHLGHNDNRLLPCYAVAKEGKTFKLQLTQLKRLRLH